MFLVRFHRIRSCASSSPRGRGEGFAPLVGGETRRQPRVRGCFRTRLFRHLPLTLSPPAGRGEILCFSVVRLSLIFVSLNAVRGVSSHTIGDH
ncbi:hypothetical protein CS379_29175 [Methylobacterium frigidaeris]|nr:hypothetical protein CS379_29175 [Methylobacterium frigidaeris]